MADQSIAAGDHKAYMALALSLARKSPPKPTNFCVGAVLLNEYTNEIITTGFTLELPGNTHAEQCCLSKVMDRTAGAEADVTMSLPDSLVFYTTMEPCNKRASGNLPCIDRILRARFGNNNEKRISKVYVGVQEPETFVGANEGKKRLVEAGIEYIHVPGLEKDILNVATAGHLS